MMAPRHSSTTEKRLCSPLPDLVPKYQWDSIFTKRREDVVYARENEPYLDRNIGQENFIRTFMRRHDESESCLFRAIKVEDYCTGATLSELRDGKDKIGAPKVALLYDRSSEGGREQQGRKYRGPLTARQLYGELRKPRFRTSRTVADRIDFSSKSRSSNQTQPTDLLSSPSDDEVGDSKLKPEPSEPDAERRKVYITNLDKWSIYALMGTASEHQSKGLRDTIYKYLVSESFIGVEFPPTYLSLFILSFHIPFYAWRTSNRPACEDHRSDANGTRLRASRDVSFLNLRNRESSYLYQAQWSCLVSGSDDDHWVAYGLFDTYFDHAEDSKETVESYHEEATQVDGMPTDPLAYGTIALDTSIQRPREYFLCVLRSRIQQVYAEWEQIVANIRDSMKEYDKEYRPLLCKTRDRDSLQDKIYDERFDTLRDYIVGVKRLTTDLLQELSRTVDALEKFSLNHAIYFQNLPERRLGREDQSLHAIQTVFEGLESQKASLGFLADNCTEYAKELELHLILKGVEMGSHQHKLATVNKGLAVTMIIISPIAIAAQMMSMNKDVISFIPPRFGSFIGLTFVLCVAGLILHFILQYPEWCWQFLLSLAGQQKWRKSMLRKKTSEGLG